MTGLSEVLHSNNACTSKIEVNNLSCCSMSNALLALDRPESEENKENGIQYAPDHTKAGYFGHENSKTGGKKCDKVEEKGCMKKDRSSGLPDELKVSCHW